MRPSSACRALVQRYEGCVLVAYQDPGGIWTIGWGHTGAEVRRDLKWSQLQADRALDRDLQTAGRWVETLTSGVELTQGQYDAMTSFVFNIGAGALSGSTLLKKLKAGDLVGAANEFLRWDHEKEGGGEIESAGLAARRADERRMFLSQDGEDDAA